MPPQDLTNASGDRTHAIRAFLERSRQGGTPPVSAQTPPPPTALPTGSAGLQPQQPMMGGAVQQLQKSQPGEAEIIIKALIQRLRSLTPQLAQI